MGAYRFEGDMPMLFDKNVERICAFCRHSCDFDDRNVLCCKKGPVPHRHSCRRFRYDPLRRRPAPAAPLKKALPDEAFCL